MVRALIVECASDNRAFGRTGMGLGLDDERGSTVGVRPRAMNKDEQSETEFSSLYDTTLTPLRRYLASMLGNGHEAQDIAHDAYIKTLGAMEAKPVKQPKAFLFTTARRLALNYLTRRAHRMQPTEDAELEAKSPLVSDVRETAVKRQEHAALRAAILELPKGCQAVLVLRNFEGLSHQEISERLGIARSTVEKQLARAIRLLREKMKEMRA